jgi:RNA polymerase sigma factor (sigma-70 family)
MANQDASLPEEGWKALIDGLNSGEERVLQEFYDRYGPTLHLIANSRLRPGLQRRFDADDVVQSTMRTFFRRVQAGSLEVDGDQRMWNLLCAITLTKLREKTRFHMRLRRAIGREGQFAAERRGESDDSRGFEPPAPIPAPGTDPEFAEAFENVVAALSEPERALVNLKLQDCSNAEVAATLDMSERTVQRMLKRLQAKFECLLDESR